MQPTPLCDPPLLCDPPHTHTVHVTSPFQCAFSLTGIITWNPPAWGLRRVQGSASGASRAVSPPHTGP